MVTSEILQDTRIIKIQMLVQRKHKYPTAAAKVTQSCHTFLGQLLYSGGKKHHLSYDNTKASLQPRTSRVLKRYLVSCKCLSRDKIICGAIKMGHAYYLHYLQYLQAY